MALPLWEGGVPARQVELTEPNDGQGIPAVKPREKMNLG